MKHTFFILIFLFLSLTEAIAIAPPPGGADPPCWPPPCIPIDGGLGLLIACGAIYGGKKVYDLSKKN
jgi:hypothetical protein